MSTEAGSARRQAAYLRRRIGTFTTRRSAGAGLKPGLPLSQSIRQHMICCYSCQRLRQQGRCSCCSRAHATRPVLHVSVWLHVQRVAAGEMSAAAAAAWCASWPVSSSSDTIRQQQQVQMQSFKLQPVPWVWQQAWCVVAWHVVAA